MLFHDCRLYTYNFPWEQIYFLPRKITIDSYSRCFQYKIINNVLFLNKKLFCFNITSSPYCSFCGKNEETTIHIFCECEKTRFLWSELRLYFPQLSLPELLPQTALFGFYENSEKDLLILNNHILLLFKLYIYREREKKDLSLEGLLSIIIKTKKIEKNIATKNYKIEKYNKKWKPIEQHLLR